MSKPLSILLDPEESEILSDIGAAAFIVISRGSYPHSTGRWQLWAVPCTITQADAAVRVARGEARTVKISNQVIK